MAIVEPEEWRYVPGHAGYEVSSLGRVRSVDRLITDALGRSFRRRGKVLKPFLNNKGYPLIDLGPKTRALYRVVLDAFAGPCPPGMEGAHKNAVRTDCRASNLEWKTHAENVKDRERHGNTARRERSGSAKLTNDQVIAIRANAEGLNNLDLAALYDVSAPHISRLRRGLKWR